MNAKCDDGDIVKQIHIAIEDDDTGACILKKYNEIYPSLVKDIVLEIKRGTIVAQKQDISRATYFGKRTPDDGLINWNWQKERIRNWVRAQAEPYPGAFSYIKGNKVIINKITYSDFGFTYDIPNGYILGHENEKPLVKTPNGVIILEDYKTDFKIHEGDIFE